MNVIPGVQQAAFSVDGNLAYSHPVSTMDGPLFDTITYQKGASLLRMLNFTLGPDVLQNGLRSYIQQYKFGNANHEQLWAALTTVCCEFAFWKQAISRQPKPPISPIGVDGH
jgi:aminopeptidase N